MGTALDVVDRLTTAVTHGRLDEALELIAEDAVDHSPLPGAAPGHRGWRQKWQAMIDQADQVRVEVEHRIASGDTVASRYAIRAAATGERLGVALDMLRVADGKIVEHWALPAPSAAG